MFDWDWIPGGVGFALVCMFFATVVSLIAFVIRFTLKTIWKAAFPKRPRQVPLPKRSERQKDREDGYW